MEMRIDFEEWNNKYYFIDNFLEKKYLKICMKFIFYGLIDCFLFFVVLKGVSYV